MSEESQSKPFLELPDRVPQNAKTIAEVPQASAKFRTVPKHAEDFGNVPQVPKIPDAVVVGIRYDLLKTDDSSAGPAAESPSDQIRPKKLLTSKRPAPAIKTKPTKPILKKFQAINSRVA